MADVEVYRTKPVAEISAVPESHNEAEQKSFQDKLNEIPLVTMTLSQLFSTVETLKERNEYIQRAFDTGEHYVKALAGAAKPVVVAATSTALNMAKPVVGEIQDPVASLDNFAAGALAKVEEKIPMITQTPSEMVDTAKSAVQQSTNHYIGKITDSYLAKTVHNQVDNAVSLSELVVEICFPTDGSSYEDMAELEREDQQEQGTIERVKLLKNRVQRRWSRKLVTYKPVAVGIDAVTYAQDKISEMNGKLQQGTNFVTEISAETSQYLKSQQEKASLAVQDRANKTWDQVYSTSMYLPNKAMEITGEVFISAKEMVFAYSKAHSITEMPHAIVEMSEKYYKSIADNLPEIQTKAVAFVVVPAQVVSEYVLSARVVEWIVPSIINADEIKIIEEISMDDVEQDLQQ